MSSQNGQSPASDDAAADSRHNLASLTPRVDTLAATSRTNSSQHQHLGTRAGLSGDTIREALWTNQYGGERSLYEALGYVLEPRYEHFRARYERTDEARALVDKLPNTAWATPEINDPGSEDGQSAFEQAVGQFLEGESGGFSQTGLEPLASADDLEALGPSVARGDVIDVCRRVSRMERLGEFALLFLGLDDANVADGDVGSLAEPVDISSLDSLDDLTHIDAYDEGRAHDEPFDLYDDVTDPRFNTPEYYSVDLGHGEQSSRIHHSRVIHVVDNVFEDDLRSNSVLEQSLNRLDDIEKIQGASAEAYWRTAYQGLVASPPQVEGQLGSFSDAGEDLHEQIRKYYANFQRAIFTPADVDTLDVAAEDPTPHLETKYRSLAAGHGIPQSILMGNETGERATQEDRRLVHELAADYRERFCEARVLRPLINRLVYYGIVPPPAAGEYEVIWPPQDEPGEQEHADIAATKATALADATGGNPTLAASVGEIREALFDWNPDLGSEADGGDAPSEMATPESVAEMAGAGDGAAADDDDGGGGPPDDQAADADAVDDETTAATPDDTQP
jgi:hypothetical protein